MKTNSPDYRLFLLIGVVASLAMGAASEELRITAVGVNAAGRPVLTHPSDSAHYYTLYRGAAVTEITSPVNMAIGSSPQGQMDDPLPLSATAFYRLQETRIADPFDTDGDGIDDVWELRFRHSGAALNSSDANADHTGNGTPDLQEYLASLPLTAWFTSAESSALSYGGTYNIQVRFTRPVTGAFAYEIGGNALAGKDYQPLNGQFLLNNATATSIPVQIRPSIALGSPRSIVLTLKSPGPNVGNRVLATPSEGKPNQSRFSSHVITIRDADQGLYSGNLNFLSEITRTITNGSTNVIIKPAPAVAPSTLRMALRSNAPGQRAIIELPECILFTTNRLAIPVSLAGNYSGFAAASPLSGVTQLPHLGNRTLAWTFAFSSLAFTNAGQQLNAQCQISLHGLTASGTTTVLRGTISATRIDP